jgi:hypothetical protein
MPPVINTAAPGGNDNSWRVQRLEDDFSKLATKIDGVSAALTSGLATIAGQIASLQVSMPDHYMPRREFDVTKELLEGRVKALEATQSKALWLVLGTLLTTLMNVGLLAFKSLTGHP